eukprot:339883-Amphidinium_carterae.3
MVFVLSLGTSNPFRLCLKCSKLQATRVLLEERVVGDPREVVELELDVELGPVLLLEVEVVEGIVVAEEVDVLGPLLVLVLLEESEVVELLPVVGAV